MPSVWRRLLWLLVPGAALHELTHAAVAGRWGSWEIDWYREAPWWAWPSAAIIMRFPNDAPGYAPTVAKLAPLIVGLLVGVPVAFLVASATAALWGYVLPMLAGSWVLINIGYYLGASSSDLEAMFGGASPEGTE